MGEKEKLTFAEVKRAIGDNLKTALNVENFDITFAKLEKDEWRVNVAFQEAGGLMLLWNQTALFTIDAWSGDVKVFERGRAWTT